MVQSTIINLKQNDHANIISQKVLKLLDEEKTVQLSNRPFEENEFKSATAQKLTSIVELIKGELIKKGSTIYQYNNLSQSPVNKLVPVLTIILSVTDIEDIGDEWTRQITEGK